MPDLMRLRMRRAATGLLGLALAAAACQSPSDRAGSPAPPPVGHYAGSLSRPGRPELRVALDIRHPSPGHYEAELTVPAAPALSFVADTVIFAQNQLRLARPLRPGQTLALTLEGDFWRGTAGLDSATATAVLLKRGGPLPSTYRVEEVPQAEGSAWLYAPADVGMAGPALALLPDSATGAAAPIWADALAREGIIVLVLPATNTASPEADATQLLAALRLLRNTAGADTAHLGAWAAGPRAAALAQALAAPAAPRAAYLIAQNAPLDAAARAAFRQLKGRKLPVLGLCGGPAAAPQAAALRGALGGRSAAVRAYRTAGADLLVPGEPSRQLGPGLPADVVQWLRSR
ncbi:hypothetical protein [Hymenobacter ruricola]|uniref:Uncharacterized protein n=1 Tax=Hymenobacter ruricola TaxID=2791023 RepID=A0ABS0I9K3_9BACT|nr:hypothetical protein [Hymenobacter ruricola]MBF9223645.1 hypothetical protein [Hymenobacter ruricola]